MLRRMLDAITSEIKSKASEDRRILPTQDGPSTGDAPKWGAASERPSSVPFTRHKSWKNDPLGELLLQIDQEMRQTDRVSYHELRASDSAAFQALKDNVTKRTELARFIFKHRFEIIDSKTAQSWKSSDWRGFAIFTALMRGTLDVEADEILEWIILLNNDVHKVARRTLNIGVWPVSYMIQMVERLAKKTPLTEGEITKLKTIRAWDVMGKKSYYGMDFKKIALRIDSILADAGGADTAALPYNDLPGDEFGNAMVDTMQVLAPDETDKWNRLLHLAAKATGAKPTKAFTSQAKQLKDDLDKEWVRTQLQAGFETALKAKTSDMRHEASYGDYVWTTTKLFTDANTTLVKGLVWLAEGYQDARTINQIADLCEKAMKKIPGVGPASQAVANACLRYLEVTPGAEATARLARLATAVKQKSVQKKVAALVEKKAEAAGISSAQLEERVIPKYGLDVGEKTVAFDNYALKIAVEGVGRVSQSWIKPDGSTQKTKPKFVGEKEALKTKFNKAKAEITAMKKVLTAQRDRIDRLFAEDLEWPLAEIEEYYVGHPLLCVIAPKYIWTLMTGTTQTPALWRDGAWQDIKGDTVKTDDTTVVRLWHPVDVTTDDVMAWRARLSELGIVQPTKQAFREVYLLTDAERRTDVYSNRMAAHMLKQHQMSTLMAARGWKYQNMGGFDDGLDDQWALREFQTSDLVAEFLIHTNMDTDNYTDAGIYIYVGTDQLRFTQGGQPVSCESISKRIFSETMREADLFVGVASVGNDPAWFDQGPTPEARNYWQSYSFGNLDNFAETRKQVLETLLPRLKIRDVVHIDGKFLYVDGKLNTYKIHLGSSNIMMAPGDRYLCIVSGNVRKGGSSVTLPFEGDARLSMIISKALMLAEDDKITDPVITSQLRR